MIEALRDAAPVPPARLVRFPRSRAVEGKSQRTDPQRIIFTTSLVAHTQRTLDRFGERTLRALCVERPEPAAPRHQANPLAADHDIKAALEHRGDFALPAVAQRAGRASAH